MSARTVVEEALRYWSAQDVETTLQTFSEDAVYALNIENELGPLSDETRGREAIRAAFYDLLRDLDHRRWEARILGADTDTVRVAVEAHMIHRKSGRELITRYRIVARVKDGLIVRLDEFHDRALLEAFFALAAVT